MPTGTGGTPGSGTPGTSGTPTPAPTGPGWFKRNWVVLTAGTALLGVCVLGIKSCADNTDERVGEALTRVERIEASSDSINARIENIDVRVNRAIRHQTVSDSIMERNDSVLFARQRALEDSINVHREVIDSLRHDVDSVVTRVDTIAARQEKCPCVNPAPKKKPAQRPARPNNVPVRRDTVVVVVKEEPAPVQPVQNANGCGDDQNANVVIHGNNNTVNISNNGNAGRAVADTIADNAQIQVSGTCTMRTRVTSTFTWKSR